MGNVLTAVTRNEHGIGQPAAIPEVTNFLGQ
jgi:hypothetical protein